MILAVRFVLLLQVHVCDERTSVNVVLAMCDMRLMQYMSCRRKSTGCVPLFRGVRLRDAVVAIAVDPPMAEYGANRQESGQQSF